MGTWEQQKSAGNSEKHLYNLRNPFNLNYRATLNKHVDEEDRGTVAIRDTPTQKKGRILLYVDSVVSVFMSRKLRTSAVFIAEMRVL